MLEAFGDHAKRQRLHAGNRLVAVNAVAHNARQGRHLSQPATVVLALDLDRKNHGRTVPSGPAVSQANGADASDVLCNAALRLAAHSRALGRLTWNV